MKSFPRKPFYLVRHGESFANRFEYPSGRMDTRLTRLGWAQAREAALIAARLDEKPSIMVASALVRARETAKLIQAGVACDLKIDRHLGEQFYGTYQGVSKDRIRAQYGHEIWWVKPLDGEGMPAFSHRVMGAMGKWLNRYDLPMFVAHGGLYTAFGNAFDRHIRGIPNASVFRFEPTGKKGWNLHWIENKGAHNETILYCRL